jgi:chromosome segregation ATPase
MKSKFFTIYRLSTEGSERQLENPILQTSEIETKKPNYWSKVIKNLREKLAPAKVEMQQLSRVELLKAEIEKLNYEEELMQVEINTNQNPKLDEKLNDKMNIIFNKLGLLRQEMVDIQRLKTQARLTQIEHSDIVFIGVVVIFNVYFWFFR